MVFEHHDVWGGHEFCYRNVTMDKGEPHAVHNELILKARRDGMRKPAVLIMYKYPCDSKSAVDALRRRARDFNIIIIIATDDMNCLNLSQVATILIAPVVFHMTSKTLQHALSLSDTDIKALNSEGHALLHSAKQQAILQFTNSYDFEDNQRLTWQDHVIHATNILSDIVRNVIIEYLNCLRCCSSCRRFKSLRGFFTT